VPFPGSYVVDEDGVVVAKFFHESYKKRDSPEILIDAALGRTQMAEDAPGADGGDAEVRIAARLHGGRGTIRQGIRRHLVVRFELSPGLHLYAEPVPEGMIATRVELLGPEGLVAEEPILPATQALELPGIDHVFQVWSGTFEIAVPVYAVATLISECRPLDRDRVEIELRVRYQACDDTTCLVPKSETLRIEVGLEPVDMPDLAFHGETGQRRAPFEGLPHMRRLVLRMAREHPLGVLRSIATQLRLGIAGRLRARRERSKR
jgi:hypothetical protein